MAKKILVAEDEPNVLKTLSRNLKELGYEVVQAVDGDEAIQKIEQEKPDLVLLDVIMPKKNGFGVLQEMRTRLNSHVPVIVLSNLDREKDIETGKMYDIKDYLVKSNISLRELSSRVSKAIQQAGS